MLLSIYINVATQKHRNLSNWSLDVRDENELKKLESQMTLRLMSVTRT